MGSPSGEKFCLKWNDFDNNLRSSFQQFREEKDFFDVSLVCEDEQIEAHKTILSACSVFFKKLFKRHQHQHPLVYLKGVKFGELTQLLQFVYQGEVNVAREDLSSFLEAAEELKIHGLTQDLHNETKPKSKPKSKPEKKSAPPPPPPAALAAEPEIEMDSDVLVPAAPGAGDMFEEAHDDIAEVSAGDDPLGLRIGGTYSEFDESNSADMSDDSYLLNNLQKEHNEKFNYDSLMTKIFDDLGTHVFECNICKKVQRRKDHMRNHVQTHLNQEVNCHLCGAKCKNPASLKVHISQRHRLLQNKYTSQANNFSFEINGTPEEDSSIMKLNYDTMSSSVDN